MYRVRISNISQRGCEAWGLFIDGIEVKSRERERYQCYAELSNIGPTSFRSMFNGYRYVQFVKQILQKKGGILTYPDKNSDVRRSMGGRPSRVDYRYSIWIVEWKYPSDLSSCTLWNDRLLYGTRITGVVIRPSHNICYSERMNLSIYCTMMY